MPTLANQEMIAETASIALRLEAHPAPITPELQVQRALPSARLKAIGPFVFLDHFGPMAAPAGGVPPHPHAGIEVITYLLSGSQRHRDSLGHSGHIQAGGAQWFKAGRGLLHAEAPEGEAIEGVQLWTRLPVAHEDDLPEYAAFGPEEVPSAVTEESTLKLLAGPAWPLLPDFGPIVLAQPAFLAHVTLEPHGQLILPLDPEQQYGIFVMHGKVSVDGGLVGANTIALLKSASQLDLVNPDEIPASLLVLGGEPAELPLVYRGAFVYNSHAAAENAEQRYLTGRMGQLAGVPV